MRDNDCVQSEVVERNIELVDHRCASLGGESVALAELPCIERPLIFISLVELLFTIRELKVDCDEFSLKL
jgi:hypothetical protein